MSEPNDETHELVKEEDLPEGVSLRKHVYDGIQEYDQKLPNWWLATFHGAIIFFFGYWFALYQLGYYKSDEDRLDARLNEIADRKAADLEKQVSTLDDARFWEMSQDPVVVATGKAVYESSCVACHSADLTAMMGEMKLPGLPLDDSEWKYGGSPMEVFNTVMNGSPDKASGMQAWEPVFGATKSAQVVAYVMSFHDKPAE